MADGFLGRKVMVAGLGLIGGSVARALKRAGYTEVYAFDKNGDTLKSAANDGIAEYEYTRTDRFDFDIIISCLPPRATVGFVQRYAEAFMPGSVFAEMGGLKKRLLDEITDALPKKVALLPLHPMAGSEKEGYMHSSADMFKDACLITIETDRKNESAGRWETELTRVLGCGRLCRLTPEAHDEIIAKVSHIPHIVALAVKNMGKDADVEGYAGGSYRSVTRVADINAGLWAELLTGNREYLIPAIKELKAGIKRIEQEIAQGDAAALERMLLNIAEKKGAQ